MKDERLVQALRILSTDAINRANSGHPGICLGAAPIVNTLFTKILNLNPKQPQWINRDRFILSAGHGAPLLYAAMHFAGFDISIDDMKNLRQLHSKTAGHPECDLIAGIDASTGPLGQGIAMGVGMALAERYYEASFNEDGYELFDNYTYVLCGDGCLQEGVAQEALSFCGHQKLDKFILIYDSNEIQLDGNTNMTISEDCRKKYEAMGFNYLLVENGNDTEAIFQAIQAAKSQHDKPSFIEIKTIIGFGTDMSGTCACHGTPIGEENANSLRSQFDWPYDPFVIPEEIYQEYQHLMNDLGIKKAREWQEKYQEYQKKYPDKFDLLNKFQTKEFNVPNSPIYPEGFNEATRNTGGKILEMFQHELPNLLGGSADLTKSTKAKGINGNSSKENPLGRNICYGVREHAMGAITNGLTLYGGLMAFSGAFFVFSDYMKPAIRMAALMKIPSIFVFTHDSVMVGEDGPTHEPIEQLEALRCMPNVNVIRPADARETYMAFKCAYESKTTPTVIVLSRQNLVVTQTSSEKALRGGYVVLDTNKKIDYVLLATGSEVSLAYHTAKILSDYGKGIRVVSMPSEFLFEKQTSEYKNSILLDKNQVIAIEMGSTHGWYKYANKVIGIDCFGLSAPAKVLAEHFGFTPEALAERILSN